MIVDKIQLNRPLKVVMDCGNATASLVAPEIFERLGTFIEPDKVKKELSEIK